MVHLQGLVGPARLNIRGAILLPLSLLQWLVTCGIRDYISCSLFQDIDAFSS